MGTLQRLFFLSMAIILGVTACQLPSFGGAGSVLYQDDFEDPSTGWDQILGTEGLSNYKDGGYRIYVKDQNKDIWANPGLNFSDVIIEVEGTKLGGPDLNDFGLLCRADDNNWYSFILSSNGNYAIGKRRELEQTNLSSGSIPNANTLLKNPGPNLLRAECVGAKLAFYLNGEKLAEVEDDALTVGAVGLIAGTFDEPETDILFDNFVVKKP